MPLRHLLPPPDGGNSIAFDRENEGNWASFDGGFAYGLLEDGFEKLLDVVPRSTRPAGGRSSVFDDSSIRDTSSLEDVEQFDRRRHETDDSLYGPRSTGLCELITVLLSCISCCCVDLLLLCLIETNCFDDLS